MSEKMKITIYEMGECCSTSLVNLPESEFFLL
jgi:hypothetical protein